MDKYKDKKIAVVGYQLEGKSLVDFFIKQSAKKIEIFDENINLKLEKDHEEKVVLNIGKLEDQDLASFDFVFRSPGIMPDRLKVEKEKISSMTNLFFELKKGTVIGVTGTKGKSTTVLLIESILKANGKKVFVAGNIGKSLLDLIDQLSDESFSILELSSFQLMDCKHSPEIAVILPLFDDHLDMHVSSKEYFTAKSKIFTNSGNTKIISSLENKQLLGLGESSNESVYFSVSSQNTDYYIEEGSIYSSEDGLVTANAIEFCKVNIIQEVNLLAAVALAKEINMAIDLNSLVFKKLPFRVELIQNKCGVNFYNDSASTNPISTISAIDMLDSDMALLIGGSDKGLEIDELINKLIADNNVKRLYLFGLTSESLEDRLLKKGYDREVYRFEKLSEIFESLDLTGCKNVLFSPAFASFDQYKNYKARGEEFNELVNNFRCKNM